MRVQESEATLVQKMISRSLLTSIGLVAILLIITLVFFTPRYEVNDDAMMNLVVAGRIFTDSPDEHILYSNVLIGLMLKNLYQRAPNFPWYGGYLLSVTLAALVGISYALLRANRTGSQIIMTALFLAIVGLPCLVEMQFTKAGALAGLAGLLLFMVALRGGPSGLRVWATGVIFVVVGSMVRYHGYLLMLIVIGPALAFMPWATKNARDRWKFAVCIGIAVGSGWGLAQYNQWYYAQDDRWSAYYERNALIVQFVDYWRVAYNEQTQPVFEEVGWSKIDLAMINNWNFIDEDRFSDEKLRTILQRAGMGHRIKRVWSRPLEEMAENGNLLTLLVCFLTCLLFAGSWRARIVPLLCLGTVITVCILLIEFFRLPNRVYYPAFGAVLALTIAWSGCALNWRDLLARNAMNYLRCGMTLLTSGMLAWSIGIAWHRNMLLQVGHESMRQMVEQIKPRPDQLFVLWREFFYYENLVYPLENMTVPRNFKAVTLSGFTHTPFTGERLKEFGITDLNRAIFDRKNVFVVSKEWNNILLSANASEKYKIRLGARVVFAHPALQYAAIYQYIDLGCERPTSRSNAKQKIAP